MMGFYIKDQSGLKVALHQDEDDVNISIGGKIVAWLAAYDNKLVLCLDQLASLGIDIEETPRNYRNLRRSSKAVQVAGFDDDSNQIYSFGEQS